MHLGVFYHFTGMTASNRSSAPEWKQHFTALPTIFGLIPVFIFCGIIANNAIVLVTFKRMGKLKLQHYLMIALAVADLLTLIPVSAMVLATINGSIWLTETLCVMLGVSFINTLGTTSWLHSLMCIEKCLSIWKPLQHRSFSLNKSAGTVIGGVLGACFFFPIALPLAILYLEQRPIIFSPYLARCSYLADKLLLASAGLLFIVIPLIIELVTHVAMIARIWKLGCMQRKQRIKRAMKVTSFTVGVYYCCWLPTVMYSIAGNILGPRVPSWLFFIVNNCLIANSCMSGIIYSLSLKGFRVTLCSRGVNVMPSSVQPSDHSHSLSY